MKTYDLIIVGSGPAGMTASIYAARANLSVLMLDKLAPGGQIVNTNEIQNYTGMGTINGAERWEMSRVFQPVFRALFQERVSNPGSIQPSCSLLAS